MKKNGKKFKEEAKEMKEMKALIKATSYELAGEIGSINNEEMMKNEHIPKTQVKTYKEHSSLKKKR